MQNPLLSEASFSALLTLFGTQMQLEGSAGPVAESFEWLKQR